MKAQYLLCFVTVMVMHALPSRCVILGDEESIILQEVIDEFRNSPLDPKFDHVIYLPIDKAHLVPKVFIWCPLSHFKIPIRCPIDNNPLKIQSFAKSVPSSKSKERAPRLIYDVGGNVLLVQTYYVCMKNNGEKHHTYMSATHEIMDKLPENISKRFPFILHYKSGFSKDLLDFLIVSLSQGHTFLEITEMLGSLNYHKFVERSQLAGGDQGALKPFQDNILYSFPSGDKLMHVFLWDFERKSESYKRHINSITCTTLVCDGSYKMEKKCKVKGSGNGSGKDMHLENLFLGVNENGEVVLWKPVISKHFHDIKDILVAFKERLDASGQELNAILVHDCCQTRAMYQQIFPTVPVKMGIVHAIKAATDTLPKDHPDTMVFAHKLLQIFTSSPSEEQRTEETASPLEIEANLDFFLTNWRSRLSEPTMLAMDTLRHHIRRGCLSGIPPGEGTEKIDSLHRYIQKSFLGRVTVITPDMAFAIFTCLLYAWNCKKQCKSIFKGKKVIPVMPIEAHDPKHKTSSDQSKIDVKGLADEKGVEPLVIQCTQQAEEGATVSSMLVITADVLEYMFVRLLHIQDLINAFKDRCQKFGMSDLPIFSANSGISSYEKLISESSEQEKSADVLRAKLAVYGLQIDKVPGDGNCLFRSIVIQVQKLAKTSSDLQKHLDTLGMGMTQEKDTTKLRELFVAELQNNFAGYKDWINFASINLEQDLRNFSENGFFASDIGDLCIKVCANVLQLPIIVIPSLPNVKFFPFLPTKFCTGSPVYVAYNHSAPGHYDATKEILLPDPSKNKCKCGRKNKYSNNESESSKMSCDPKDTKCPCAAANIPCVFCHCYNCQNKPTPGTPISCRCNSRGKTSSIKSACLNKERATCCCAKAGLPCTENCFCRSCGNGKPNEEVEETVEEETPRKRQRKGFKRKPGEIKEDPEKTPASSEWTEQEVICLIVCKEVLAACNVEQNVHNLSQVFQYIAKSKNNSDLGLAISLKDDTAIQQKLEFLQTHVVTQFVTITTSTLTTTV